MKNNKNLLIIIILMLVVISMGTYAWLSYRSNETAMVLTIGEVGSMSITLKPYKFSSSIDPTITYEDNDYVQVTASNETSNDAYNIGLYYKINNIPEELINQTFKYTILRSIDGENYSEYDEGNFSNAKSGSEYIILDNETLMFNKENHYRVYLWIEGSITDNTDMQNKVFNAELRASYEKATPDLEYKITKVNNTDSNTLDMGFYTLSNYNCDNNTTLTFDTYSRKITTNRIDKCDLEFISISNPLLYDIVEIGDYISYTGDSSYGCSGNQCSGWNANQTATDIYDNYGYCYSSNYKYYVYGWRVIYKTDNSVYIVSAGSPECVAGTSSNSVGTKTSLNAATLKYCNTSYLSGGVCNESTAHALNGDDFYKFTTQYYGNENGRYLYSYKDGGTYGSPYCYNKYSNTYCGYNNDIIDNGGNYWFGSGYSSTNTLQWYSSNRNVSNSSGTSANGVRPVLKLDSSVRATGGKGTMDNPYTISTRN